MHVLVIVMRWDSDGDDGGMARNGSVGNHFGGSDGDNGDGGSYGAGGGGTDGSDGDGGGGYGDGGVLVRILLL